MARYTYVFNNPLTGTDPSGFFSLGWLDPFGGQARDAYKALGDFARNPFDNFNLYALERSMPGRATMDNFVFSHSWAEAIGHAALGVVSLFCTGAAPACMTAMEMHVAGYKTWAMGGDRDDVLGAMIEAGATTVISAAGNQVIGGIKRLRQRRRSRRIWLRYGDDGWRQMWCGRDIRGDNRGRGSN